MLIGFYGEHDTTKRMKTRTLFTNLKQRDQSPWMVIGDFNEIFFSHEKMGGKQKSEELMTNFRLSMDNSDLHDLWHKGDIFTWSNRHTNETFTKERLDRALANIPWTQIYTRVGVETVARCFDHKLILASCIGQLHDRPTKKRLFRYEVSWDLEKDCNVKINQC